MAAAAIVAISLAPPQDATLLAPGPAIERELGARQSHVYRLALSAGEFVHITIRQAGVDLSATIKRPDGATLLAVDTSREIFRPETIAVVADASGEHTVTVRANSAASGRYVIHVDDLHAAGPRDETRVAAERAFERGCVLSSKSQPVTYRQALTEFQQAMGQYRETGDRAGEMKAAIEVANMQRYLSLPEALASAQFAADLTRQVGDEPAQVKATRVLGLASAEAGDRLTAIRALETATAISRRLGDARSEAVDLSNVGLIYGQTGDSEQAIASIERSLQLTRSVGGGGGRNESMMLNNLGIAYKDVGLYDKAQSIYQQALATMPAGDRDVEALVINNMGNIERLLGNHEQALELHTRALDLSRVSGNKSNEARSLNTIGLTYYALGDYAQALQYHREALAIRRQLADRSAEAASLDSVGRALHASGDDKGSLAALGGALTIRETIRDQFGRADTLQHLAEVERDRGRLTEARRHIEAAVDLDESLREQITSPELRATYVAAEHAKYELFIDVLHALDRTDPAGGHRAAALAVSERARARVLLESLVDAHVDLRQGIEPALLERERRLQRQLNDASTALSRSLARTQSKDQASALVEKVDRLGAEYQQLRALIRQNSPRYAAVTQPQPLDAAAIQQSVVDEGTVLLEFALGEERSWLWAVTPHTLTSVELPARREIERAARTLYQRLTARQKRRGETSAAYAARVAAADAALDADARAVSHLLFTGVARQLSAEWKNKRLAIAATGVLEYLPFAALPVPGRADRVLLATQHEIVAVPSASVLATLRRETAHRAQAPRMLAILADPVFESNDPRLSTRPSAPNAPISGDATSRASSVIDALYAQTDLSRLPFSRDEANTIAALAEHASALKATDFKASRALVLSGALSGHRIVHFATHGVVNSDRPSMSALILSLVDERGARQNGYLRLHDIYNLRLDADLVVLSACQTALGKEIKGEGLVGLTRAFFYAGAPRVVASLWQVNDLATAELMKKFYRGLLQQRLRPAAALRAAQLEMSRDPRWKAPYFWAGFVLQGEWR